MLRPILIASILLSILSLCVAATRLHAEDTWSRFRGPNGVGAVESPVFPAKWTEKDYRWKTQLPGIGYSSPVVWGDRIYITSGLEEDATLLIFSLNAKTGEIVWQQKILSETHSKHNLNCYASSTPAVDEQHLYVALAHPKMLSLVALEKSQGKEVWRRDFGPFLSQHGFGASPIVYEDLVILPNDQDSESSVIAVDRTTGKTRWQAPRRTQSAGFSTPMIYRPDGGSPQLVLTSWSHGFSGLDPKTGKTLWELPVLKFRVVGSPMEAAGLIVAAAGVGGVGRQTVAVQPGVPEKGVAAREVYSIEQKAVPLPYVPTPVAKGDLLFLLHDKGVISCVDAASGNLIWKERIGGDYFSSPIRVGDRLYCVSREGDMLVFAASKKYELLAKFPLGEKSNSTPAVAGDTMYLRTNTHLMALPAK